MPASNASLHCPPCKALPGRTEAALERELRDALGEGDYEDGYGDCHLLREAYGCVAYRFIPFRHAEAITNLQTKLRADERVLIDDVEFQTQAAISIERGIGELAR
jgi:hypothetical protein